MKSIGQTAYEGYCAHTGWRSFATVQTLPQWDGVKPEIKAAWEFSAKTLLFENLKILTAARAFCEAHKSDYADLLNSDSVDVDAEFMLLCHAVYGEPVKIGDEFLPGDHPAVPK